MARRLELIAAVAAKGSDDPSLTPLYEEAVRDTVGRFEATGSPVVTDGEQRKYHNFWTYPVHGLSNTAPDGFQILFAAGHARRMPRLTAGPFRYKRYADGFLELAQHYATVPVKQAVISPSAVSLMYPADGIPGYAREAFIEDVLNEHETEIRRCLDKGAHQVQIDFTEGRLAMKVDPSGHLLTERGVPALVRIGQEHFDQAALRIRPPHHGASGEAGRPQSLHRLSCAAARTAGSRCSLTITDTIGRRQGNWHIRTTSDTRSPRKHRINPVCFALGSS